MALVWRGGHRDTRGELVPGPQSRCACVHVRVCVGFIGRPTGEASLLWLPRSSGSELTLCTSPHFAGFRTRWVHSILYLAGTELQLSGEWPQSWEEWGMTVSAPGAGTVLTGVPVLTDPCGRPELGHPNSWMPHSLPRDSGEAVLQPQLVLGWTGCPGS